MKNIYIFLFLLFFFPCMACSDDPAEPEPPGPPEEEVLPQIVVSKIVKSAGKAYPEVEGVPFPLFGAQIRLDAFLNCDKMSLDQIEPYFRKAQELGINCLQVPVCWNMIEPAEDQFDFSIPDRIMEYANKYDIKIELLWFSTNMIGDSFSYLVPQYILGKTDKRLYRNDEGSFWGYYGYQYALILDDEWILQRETNAVTRLFNHIRVWDSKNGEKRPVITAQIHNEPDGMVRWRIDQKAYAWRNGIPATKQEIWSMTLNALDAVGQAVKNSSYSVATRTNLISGVGIEPYPEAQNAKPGDVMALPGIDFVSFDPYKSNISEIYSEVTAYRSLNGNYPLVAENKGVYVNTPSLILATAALGGGYDIYDLATSLYFINNTSPDYVNEIDHGVYTWDLQEKPHTEPTRRMLKGLIAAAPDVARTIPADFAAFNLIQNEPLQKKTQQIHTTGVNIEFETVDAALGFVLNCGDYLLVYATEDARFRFGNGVCRTVVSGRYDAKGDFRTENEQIPVEGEVLSATGGVLYKVGWQSAGPLESNTEEYIGK